MYTILIRYELNFNFIDDETQDQKDKKRFKFTQLMIKHLKEPGVLQSHCS